MDELIAKLEAATEGSRELDDAVWAVAVKGYDIEWRTHARPKFRVPRCYCTVGHEYGGEHWMQFRPGEGGPNYTTSLDSALTLVEPGEWLGLDMTDEQAKAFMEIGETDEKTPALAVCEIALKARRSETEEG